LQKIILSTKEGFPVHYHNAAEIVPSRRGLMLYRVPKSWRERFPERTAFRATQSAGIELRFRAATRYIALELSTEGLPNYSVILALYHGYRCLRLISLPTPRFSGRLTLYQNEELFPGIEEASWRILLPYGAQTAVKALYLSEGVELSAPSARPLRWLAHGDSITQGARALSPGMTYVHLVADALGWDALNLGFGGSAWGDAPVAEYIASRQDWDVLSIAIGPNTYGGSKEPAADFARRYERFLEIIRERHPEKPILCITPIWRREDGPPAVPNLRGDTPQAYREAITQVVRARAQQDPHLALLDGLQLIGDERGLTVDLVHPDPHGMYRMAEGIAQALQKVVSL